MSSDATRLMEHESRPADEPFAVISDIHANLAALGAVLADIEARGIGNIVCLGDVVGYGPEPVECWDLVNRRCRVVVRGNHDQALGMRDMARFHQRARSAIEWTRRRFLELDGGGEAIAEIAGLPLQVKDGRRLYVHGSPAGPTMDYLLPGDAFDKPRMALEFSLVDACAFNGHSHIPGVMENGARFIPPDSLADGSYRFSGRKAILNAGSVGQPRDGDPRACYLTVEDGCARYHRVEYDAEKTCEKILAIPELDPFLGRRLLAGY